MTKDEAIALAHYFHTKWADVESYESDHNEYYVAPEGDGWILVVEEDSDMFLAWRSQAEVDRYIATFDDDDYDEDRYEIDFPPYRVTARSKKQLEVVTSA